METNYPFLLAFSLIIAAIYWTLITVLAFKAISNAFHKLTSYEKNRRKHPIKYPRTQSLLIHFLKEKHVYERFMYQFNNNKVINFTDFINMQMDRDDGNVKSLILEAFDKNVSFDQRKSSFVYVLSLAHNFEAYYLSKTTDLKRKRFID